MAFFSKRRVVFWIGLIMLLLAALQEQDRQAMLGFSPDEQYFRKLVDAAVGERCNRDIPYYRNLEGKDGSYILELNADTHFEGRMIRGQILFKSMSLLERVFLDRKDLTSITLHWYFPVKMHNQVSDRPIVMLTMDRGTESRTDWGALLARDLPVVVNEYWEHSILSKF